MLVKQLYLGFCYFDGLKEVYYYYWPTFYQILNLHVNIIIIDCKF